MFTYFIFATTNSVFKVENLLVDAGISCEIVPTPKTDVLSCSFCVKVLSSESHKARDIIESNFIEILREVNL